MTPEASVPNLPDEETAYLALSAAYSNNFLSLFIALKFKRSGISIANLSEMEFPTLVMSQSCRGEIPGMTQHG